MALTDEPIYYWTYSRRLGSGRFRSFVCPVRLLRKHDTFAVVIPLAGSRLGRELTVFVGEVTSYIPLNTHPAPGTKKFFDAQKLTQRETVPQLAAIRRLRKLARGWGPYGTVPTVQALHSAFRRAVAIADVLRLFSDRRDYAWTLFEKSIEDAAYRLSGGATPSVAYAAQDFRHATEALEALAERYKAPRFEEWGMPPAKVAVARDLYRELVGGNLAAAQVLADFLQEEGFSDRIYVEPGPESSFRRRRKRL